MKTYINCIRTPLLVTVLLSFTAAMACAQSTILGILEDVPAVSADGPNSPGVRVIFQKNGAGWQPFPGNCPDQDCLRKVSSEYPGEVAWTVGFDGRILGQVTGRTPSNFAFYAHVGLQNVTSVEHVPTVGKRSAEYGGYTNAVVYRPLVTNSQSFFNDPESWKPAQLSPELGRLLRQEFRRKFPRLCKASVRDESKLVRFMYRDEDLKLVKSYASKKQWVIARLRLKDAVDCNGVEAGFEVDDAWFVIEPRRAVQYLGSGIWLLDAGDYDNDGKSELLFAINRDNQGGYEIFYDDFKGHAVFEFGYH
jgi:hypothetical protein